MPNTELAGYGVKSMGMDTYYVKKLEEELAFAKAEAAQERKDAERYRWLRDNPWPEIVRTAVVLQQNMKWDEYIDAAIDGQIEDSAA